MPDTVKTQEAEVKIIVLTPETAKIGAYYRTTFKYPKAPTTYCPFRVMSHDAEKKRFVLFLLIERTELVVPYATAAVEISQEEAERIVSIRLESAAAVETPVCAEITNKTQESEPVMSEAETKPATIYSVAKEALKAGKTKAEAFEAVKAAFPGGFPEGKTADNVKRLIYSIDYTAKKKTSKTKAE